MRGLAVVLACLAVLACTGHGRRALSSQRREIQGSRRGRMTATSAMAKLRAMLRLRGASKVSRSLASVLRLRGSSKDDVDVDLEPLLRLRGGETWYEKSRGGYVDSLPMTSSRPRGARPTKAATYEVQDPGRTEISSPIGGVDASVATPTEHLQQRSSVRSDSVLVQGGGSLQTWSYQSSSVERVQVVLTTEGRPLDADIQLWRGPDHTPCKMRVYSEDGSTRPFSGVIETPGGHNTIAIRNVGQIEFPVDAHVSATDVEKPFSEFRDTAIVVQGGALRTFNFDTSVESVEVMLKTDGRPLNARIELLHGPNNNKQVIELYSEDGLERPFFSIIDTMGSGHVVRVVNTGPMEFPMTASVQPRIINEWMSPTDPVIG